ncbi:hypothetical protein G9A89_015173 [Geosiphon pyriformis]|nr:hypothetical protein G9A89_015173 [Geosiphon pyriformis]
MHETKAAKTATIRHVIDKRIENFCMNKDCMIRSILDKPFYKVVLDYLVVDNKLVLNPSDVKSKTRKWSVFTPFSVPWARQYVSLQYVDDNTFSDIIDVISFNGKTAGFSGIPNELWKHCGKIIFRSLLDLLNLCLKVGIVPVLWRRTWVFMIPKPYDWDDVLTNTYPIALLETAHKILSDRISLACSKFEVLCGNNFSVLHSTFTQSLIFAVSSVVKDALEKSREVWLVLQNMCKTYNSASLQYIKMCDKFIEFFGGIHKDRLNHVMTDFGLSDGYQENICGYWIDTKFVAKSGKINNMGGITSFFATSTFAVTQFILDVTSEFFAINNISINNDKTVAILINQRVQNAVFRISELPISITKHGVPHRYLGIFLSTNSLFKPSLVKAQSDIKFFSNMVLRKAISDKQFVYLVLAVFQPIVNYLLYHPLLYGLKTFKQVQVEGKSASVMSFSNFSGIVGWLFEHHFLDLQVLGWAPFDLLQFPVRLHIGLSNNFLAGIVCILLINKLSIMNNLPSAFFNPSKYPISGVLGPSLYYDWISSLKKFGVAFCDRLLDKCGKGPVSSWFILMSRFLHDKVLLSTLSNGNSLLDVNNVLLSDQFSVVKNSLLEGLGSVDVAEDAAAFFPEIGLGIGIRVVGLLFFTMAELQAVALVLNLYALLCKDFVLVGWFEKAVWVFEDHKEAAWILVDFVQNMSVRHYSELWGFRFRFRANIERDNLIGDLGVLPLVHCGLE